MDEYEEEFSMLLTRVEIFDNADQLVSSFIGGLRPQLQSALAQFDPTTIAEAHRRAASSEQQQRSFSCSNQSRSRPTEQSTAQPVSKESESQPAAARKTEEQNLR